MCPVPLHTEDRFANNVKMVTNKKSVKFESALVNSQSVAELMGVPLILRTETFLKHYKNPMDANNYKAYISQFEKNLNFEGKEITSIPPYIFDN